MQDFGGASSDGPGGFRGGQPGDGEGPGSGAGGDRDPGASPLGLGQLLLAETLGVAMARRAADILDRHRDAVTQAARKDGFGGAARDAARPGSAVPGSAVPGSAGPGLDTRQFALDDAVFTAVLDAVNDCLARFDSRPPADRWCDALLHLLDLARYGGGPHWQDGSGTLGDSSGVTRSPTRDATGCQPPDAMDPRGDEVQVPSSSLR